MTSSPKTRRVLVVDDEESVRQMERLILERAGFEVIEASDGAAALDVLKTQTPLELIVADVDMPNLAGDDMAKHVATLRPGLKVLFVTGHVPKLFKEQRLLDDDRAFLSKPFTSKGLIEAVALLRYGTLNLPLNL